MRLAVSQAFKTYICIRKMIIDKVHHLLRFLTISMSYSRFSAFYLFMSRGLNGDWVLFLLKDMKAFIFYFFPLQPISEASLSLRACCFSCLGQELRGQDGHSVKQSVEKYWSVSILAATSSCTLPLAGQGEAGILHIKSCAIFKCSSAD